MTARKKYVEINIASQNTLYWTTFAGYMRFVFESPNRQEYS
jgi:hypothetical protein